jgi:hypothetical protein
MGKAERARSGTASARPSRTGAGLMPKLTGRWKGPLLAASLIHASSLASPAAAEDDDSAACADKGQYNLFNPTPTDCMREFEPDRPDLTDNPFTVDAGHVQFEADLFNYSLSRPDSAKCDAPEGA